MTCYCEIKRLDHKLVLTVNMLYTFDKSFCQTTDCFKYLTWCLLSNRNFALFHFIYGGGSNICKLVRSFSCSVS